MRALLVVDVQPTFCEGGALGVEGGNAVAERIAEFAATHRDHYDLVVTTQDWHIDPGTHFSENPDFVDTWPPHGVAGTEEAELHPALANLNPDASVKKGQYDAAYSGYEGKDESGQDLARILATAGITTVDVVGIAESHCVKETAIDSRKEHLPTRVISDLTVPVSEELGAAAREAMAEAGVEYVTADEAFPAE
ncbi:MAG TPA: isochorismatase family protein [Actinomycetales bacterium]|nr:isochorismatase family protein [Actinomycetales bacterium]